nr:MAG: minor tail protein [Bacteriophage sp.]
MSSLKFPASLKPVVSKGYSMTRRNNVWSVDLAGGGVRQGRDTYYDVFPVSVTLITSAMGRQAFLAFLEKVDGGASSFWMAHDFGMGIEDYQVTITSTIAESTEDGINWTITFTATAEKSPFQDLENQCLINNLPDLYGCYGDCLGSFLKIYANYETTFPRIWSNEGPAGYPPINLLASTLDSRIIYDGPQIYYINRNGNLVQSAANEWPLTFIDGVAVGRVPPEVSVTNRFLYSSNFSSSNWNKGLVSVSVSETGVLTAAGTYDVTATATRGNHLINQTIDVSVGVGDKVTFSFFAKANGYNFIRIHVRELPTVLGSAVVDLRDGSIYSGPGGTDVTDVGGGWFRISETITATEDKTMSIRMDAWIYSDGVTGSFTGDGVSGVKLSAATVEVNKNTTSPVITDAVVVTRTAASAKVVMSGAASIDITYSDGSVINVLAVDGYAPIPQADSAWGSKYITRIDFNVDG